MKATACNDLVCENFGCKNTMPNKITGHGRLPRFCSVACAAEFKTLLNKGTISAWFDGRKVNSHAFTTRANMKYYMTIWADLYAGGELSIIFD